MSPEQKDQLHAQALALSKANMEHEKRMKKCLRILNEISEGDPQGKEALLASELEECFYNAKANHSRLNRIACGLLEWDIPAALSR